TFNGEGHTAYLSGDQCINSAVNTYLLQLQPPKKDTVCGDPGRGTPIQVGTNGSTDPSPSNGGTPPRPSSTPNAAPNAAPPSAAPAEEQGGSGSQIPVYIAVAAISLFGAWSLIRVFQRQRRR